MSGYQHVSDLRCAEPYGPDPLFDPVASRYNEAVVLVAAEPSLVRASIARVRPASEAPDLSTICP